MRRYVLPVVASILLTSGYVLATSADVGTKAMPVPPTPPAPREDPRYITTSGECSRSVMPDRGLITATASYQHPKSVKEASKYVMDQYEQLNTSVKAMGLKDLNIQTSDYSVNPVYQWVQPDPQKPGKQVLQGYQARLGLAVKTSSIDKLGDVIAAAGDIGIAEVGGFQLMLSDAEQRKIRDECLSEAVMNAKTKAEKMVTAGGAKLGHLMTVSEGYSQPMPLYANQGRVMMAKAMDMEVAAAPASPTIQAGSTNISISVSATFEIE